MTLNDFWRRLERSRGKLFKVDGWLDNPLKGGLIRTSDKAGGRCPLQQVFFEETGQQAGWTEAGNRLGLSTADQNLIIEAADTPQAPFRSIMEAALGLTDAVAPAPPTPAPEPEGELVEV